MKTRLAALGVSGVAARTFHSAALAQLHYFASGVGREDPAEQGADAPADRELAAGAVQVPAGRRPRDRDRVGEGAADRRRPTTGACSATHAPPIPADLMERVYREYEHRKASRGEIDFEDLLELAIRLHECDAQVRADFRDRYRAFTVDEYQDVNLLQQTLLELWLGDRDDLCVVGDDYQSIYAFTGASPRWLLGVEARFPHAEVVRLESRTTARPRRCSSSRTGSFRGSSGAEKVLRPTRASGPAPVDSRVRGRRGRGRVDRGRGEAAGRRGRRLRGDGGARADERAAGRLRGGLPRCRHPVPGLVAAAARRGAADAARTRARRLGRRRRARSGARRGGRAALRACRTSSASAS